MKSPAQLLLIILIFIAAPALAQRAGNLPHRFAQVDAFGNTWMIYPGGQLIQQGQMPFSSDMAGINIGGQPLNQAVQQAQVQDDGEVVLPNIRGNNFTLTRRFFQHDDGPMRIVDVIRNTKAQEQTLQVTLTSNINFGIQSQRILGDPRREDRTLGAMVTDGQGRIGLRVFAGRGARVSPTIAPEAQGNQFRAVFELKIPGNKEVALVHFCAVAANNEAAEKTFNLLREPKILAGIPRDLRALIVNYPSATGPLDDLQLLRGGLTDIIELANGDQLKGNLHVEKWEMHAPFGAVTIPHDQVAAMLVTPGFQPRQLLVTVDGEIIGGRLNAATLLLELAGGQKIEIPVAQVRRMGRRTGANVDATSPSSEKLPFKPMVHLRAGDRLAVHLPQEPIQFATRFGAIPLPAASIATLELQPESSPVHIVTLADGSRFSGVLLADTLRLNLLRGGELALPAGTLRRLNFAPELDIDAGAGASLHLTGEDVIAVALAPRQTLITAYGEVSINGAEVKRLARVPDTLEDLQVTLWDDTSITGRLATPTLECTLAGGIIAQVPVGAIDHYTSTHPQPAPAVIERITTLVSDLNADDWKQREGAEKELLEIGEAVIPTLRELRGQQPPEAQQRIDTILRKLNPSNTPARATPSNTNRAVEVDGMFIR